LRASPSYGFTFVFLYGVAAIVFLIVKLVPAEPRLVAEVPTVLRDLHS
jgi:hypothetical protein